MPGRLPLSKSDIQSQPAREVAYYGGVRQGFEQARAGLEAVVKHLSGLLQQNPDNVRLERYLAQLNKLLAKMHKLQMRSSRVRDRRVDRKQPKEPGSWHTPPLFGEHQEREDSLKSQTISTPADQSRTMKMRLLSNTTSGHGASTSANSPATRRP